MKKQYDIPFIEGDGIGKEISAVTKTVLKAAVDKAYNGNVSLNWVNLYAGESAIENGLDLLPKDTLSEIQKYKIAIKGPLTTPVGKGHRSINVQLRQYFDLYACVRPMKYFEGIETSFKKSHARSINIVVFRENTEDLYAGIEFKNTSDSAKKIYELISEEFPSQIKLVKRQPSIALKLISEQGTKRLMKSAINYALKNNITSITVVHKGNILKETEGAFRKWCFEVAEEFKECSFSKDLDGKIYIQERISDAFFQDTILNPSRHKLVVSTNLNGDYISDAIAACVGGIGISPGANINYESGLALFEATHGSAPDIAGKDIANPLSLILSGVMLLDYLGLEEAASLISEKVKHLILIGQTTKDLNPKDGISCSEFGNKLINEIKEN